MTQEEYKFGYDPGTPDGDKSMVIVAQGDTIIGVYESELAEREADVRREERERIMQDIIEAAEPYHDAKWHNPLSVPQLKKIVRGLPAQSSHS